MTSCSTLGIEQALNCVHKQAGALNGALQNIAPAASQAEVLPGQLSGPNATAA